MFPERFYTSARFLGHHTRQGLFLLRHGGLPAFLSFGFGFFLAFLMAGVIIPVLIVLWALAYGVDFVPILNSPWLTLAVFIVAIWLALGSLSQTYEQNVQRRTRLT